MNKLVKRPPRFIRDARRKSAYSAAGQTGWPGSLTIPSISGITVTPQTALSFTAYYAGLHVISEDLASLPIAVFKRKSSGGSKLMRGHPITQRFDRCPAGDSKEMSSMQWREAYIAHAIGWGNGYAEIDWSNGGEFLGLEMLHPNSVTPKRKEYRNPQTRRRDLYYEVMSTEGAMRGQTTVKIPPDRMLHLACVGSNGIVGYSPVALAREAIGLGKAAEQFGASLFGNGAIPKGFLTHPGKLKPEARANLRDSWNAVHQGSANANKVAVLEEGVTWTNTQINPDDAQFLLTRAFQRIEIASILRLPPHKIGDYSNADLANIEASNLDYLMTCLRPWCIRIEECINLKLLSDEEYAAGFYVKHDMRAILRASIKERGEFYQKMFQFGFSPNEIRELEDMNPISEEEGGDRRFRPANMIGLDEIAPLKTLKPGQAPEPPGEPGRPEKSSRVPYEIPFQDWPEDSIFAPKNGHFTHENGSL